MVNRGLSRWFSGKESTCNAGDMSLIPGSGRWLGGGNDNPLQYSCQGCPVDREVWRVTVHGVAKMSDTLNNNNMANKVSHLLLILLPGDLKQITYLCQYVYLEYRLFFKMQTYITTVKTKQELYKISRKDTHLPTISYISVSHLVSFYCLFKSGQIRSTWCLLSNLQIFSLPFFPLAVYLLKKSGYWSYRGSCSVLFFFPCSLNFAQPIFMMSPVNWWLDLQAWLHSSSRFGKMLAYMAVCISIRKYIQTIVFSVMLVAKDDHCLDPLFH